MKFSRQFWLRWLAAVAAAAAVTGLVSGAQEVRSRIQRQGHKKSGMRPRATSYCTFCLGKSCRNMCWKTKAMRCGPGLRAPAVAPSPAPEPPAAVALTAATPAPPAPAAEEPAGPSEASARPADPSDYSVHGDRVTVQADETLGHFADWHEVKAADLRKLNLPAVIAAWQKQMPRLLAKERHGPARVHGAAQDCPGRSIDAARQVDRNHRSPCPIHRHDRGQRVAGDRSIKASAE